MIGLNQTPKVFLVIILLQIVFIIMFYHKYSACEWKDVPRLQLDVIRKKSVTKPEVLQDETDKLQDISIIPPFPIDAVYTFAGETARNNQRSRYNGELRYSLRSLYKYAPWINAIYIVMSDDAAYPSWIVEEKAKKLHVIRQSEIFENVQNSVNHHNSQSIESRLHHISGLNCFVF